MAIPQNPILQVEHIDHYSGVADPPGISSSDYEVERRAQTAVLEWLKKYFTGVAFTTQLDPSGATESRVFEPCDLMFNQGEWPQPAVRPVIHWHLMDREEGDCVVREGFKTLKGMMVWSVLVRVSSQIHAARSDATQLPAQHPEFLCRKVASQLHWLLSGTERQALSYQGLTRLRVRPPSPIASGAQFVRSMTVRMSYHYDLRWNV